MTVRLSVSIPEAITITGLSRTSLYVAMRRGELIAKNAGRRTLIEYAALEKFLSSLPQYPTATRLKEASDE